MLPLVVTGEVMEGIETGVKDCDDDGDDDNDDDNDGDNDADSDTDNDADADADGDTDTDADNDADDDAEADVNAALSVDGKVEEDIVIPCEVGVRLVVVTAACSVPGVLDDTIDLSRSSRDVEESSHVEEGVGIIASAPPVPLTTNRLICLG